MDAAGTGTGTGSGAGTGTGTGTGTGIGAGRAGTTAPLRIDLLGPVRARRAEAPLSLGPVRRQAFLAALVLRGPDLVTYRQLLDDVWGSEPPGTGHRVLPSYVYPLRKALDTAGAGPDRSVILGGRGSYRFVPGSARTDLDELAAEAALARRAKAAGDHDSALGHAGRALGLFRGEPLTGLPGPLADSERRRLARQRRALHQDRVECLVLLGRYSDALDELMAVPLAQPHDEPLAALRMRALYGSGRQAEALTAYQETRGRLLDELGVEPGEELRRIQQAVLRRDDRVLLGRPPGPLGSPGPRAAGPGASAPGDGWREAGRHQDGRRQDAPSQDAPHQNSLHQGVPHQDFLHRGVPHEDGRRQDSPSQDAPHQDSLRQGVPHQDGVPRGARHRDALPEDARRRDAPPRGLPLQDGRTQDAPLPAAPPQAPAPLRGGSRPDRPRPRHNELPGDTACLVGREAELGLLTASVPSGAVSVVAVDGTAGVGKSALVVRAAWMLGDACPDGSLYVDLHAHGAGHESVDPRRALRRLLRTVRGTGDDLPEDGPDELTDLVTAWRTATSALRLLLVVDDARSAEQVRPLLPAGPGSRVLVAGRQRLPGLDADVRLTVEPLDTGGAVGLLRTLLGEDRADREPEAARELARRCGGLPLALRIVGARLQNRPSWTLAHLVGRMSDDARSLGELKAEDRSMAAAFRMSYDQLTPELQRGFRAVSLSPTARFDGLTLAAMLDSSREHAEDLLEDLVDASLLHQPQPGRYRLHDLVRAYARRLAAEAPGQAAADHAAVLHLYTAACRIAGDWGPEGFPTGPDVTSAPFADWREATAWLDGAGGELVDVVAYAADAGQYDHACWIAEAMVGQLVRQGHHHETRAALETALTCADMATDRRMSASLRNCMGLVDIHQGRFRQAYAWFTDALRLSGGQGDQRDRARAIAGMGAARWPLGHIEEAVAHLSEAVELAARLGDDWLAGTATLNLGAIHGNHGRYEEALAHYRTALSVAEKNGRPRTISEALCFAADAHLALGRHAEATSLLRRAADLAREAGDAPLRANTLSRLGAAEHAQGDLHAAVDTHHEALSALTEHTSTWLEMEVRTRLGQSYAAVGRRTEARREFRTALSLSGAGDHPRAYDMARDGLDSC
ncbi:tetratricopeptide repeat protein [Streptomyces sp. NBC_01077]|uniref:AfsR/SARP family transcriptional regulator n=1 Tax=Streptomyces sp. NBC_01077 TaxID=2903746 RepID=UPI00386B6153|nr:tetratricopeptide repeat protein [Streptomyces sp. NBC_01077]